MYFYASYAVMVLIAFVIMTEHHGDGFFFRFVDDGLQFRLDDALVGELLYGEFYASYAVMVLIAFVIMTATALCLTLTLK